MRRLKSGRLSFCTTLAAKKSESIATPSPRTAIAGDIMSSGSIDLRNANIERNSVKGIITMLEIPPLINPINVSLTIPADGRWSNRQRRWARIPKKAEKEKLNDRALKILLNRIGLILNEGLIRPRWSIVLNLEPNDIPTSPLRSSIAGTNTITPGMISRTPSILPRTEPANALPNMVSNNRGPASLITLLRIFCFLLRLLFFLRILEHLSDCNILTFYKDNITCSQHGLRIGFKYPVAVA